MIKQDINQITTTKPNYQLFKKWFIQNGGLFHKINFPTKIAPLDYIGVTATQNIKANQVILAVPKKLIISVTKVRDSALGPTLQKYQSLNNNENQQTQFNILTLYLIWQKMLGINSFYYPYLQAVQKGETIIHWPDQDIIKLKDPYITLEVVNQLRQQFPPIYKQFRDLSTNHPQLFSQPISWQLFMQCYAFVMTRCFGWGLPETMLIPFADFFNHNCHGVNHYTYNKKLEQIKGQKNQYQKQYIKKRKQIDLRLLGIDNTKQLPVSYQRNQRQKFVDANKNILFKYYEDTVYNSQDRLFSSQTRQYLQKIHKILIPQTYNTPLYPSSNSQDNDSQQQNLQTEQTKQKIYTKQIKRLARDQLQHRFQQPKPFANSQFEDQTTFSWWQQLDETDSYFIMSTHTHIKTGEEIINSYGRRSNRFLLVWYGFTHFNNKYDSVAFRFWDQNIQRLTGRSTFVGKINKENWVTSLQGQKIDIENCNITDQYRLKRDNLCFQLMAYLRLRIVRKNQIYRGFYIKKLLTIHKIHNLKLQRQMFDSYLSILAELQKQYGTQQQRPRLSSSYHDYFANLLIKSNKQIIDNHFEGVKLLKQVIQRLQKGQRLLDIYKSQIGQQQQPVNQQEILSKNIQKQKKYWNRRFLIGYFKLLQKWNNKK